MFFFNLKDILFCINLKHGKRGKEDNIKNKIKIIIFFFLFCCIKRVDALEPNVYFQPGIYGNKVIGKLTYYGQLGIVYLDNNLVYCLEPDKLIGNNYYVDNNYLNKLNNEDRRYFSLVSYYGYNNSNRNNVYYYMASQELIWERITKQDVYWTNQNVTKGDRYNIEIYKNEILNDINNHDKKPSFDNKKIEGNFREIITLIDNNNVLEKYDIQNNTKNIVWKKNNKLYIKIMSSKEENISLIKKVNDGISNYYISDGNQTLASLNINEQINSNISVKANNKYSMKLKINFFDSKTSEFINDKILFKIKKDNVYINDEVYEASDGMFISDFYLDEGNYEIEIINVPMGYLIDNDLKFNIVEDINCDTKEINEYLNLSKGSINIVRTFEYTDKIYIKNMEYGIYAKDDIYENNNLIYKKDSIIKKVKTDENGQAKIESIPLGKYYIKEKSIIDNVISLKNSIDVDLKYIDNKTNNISKSIILNTLPIKINLDMHIIENKQKCDENKCIKEIRDLEKVEYGIYSKNNIYINSILITKKDQLILKLSSDNKGLIKENIDILEGEYYIKELTDMSNYENKFEIYEFIVDNEKNIDLNVEKIKKEKIKNIQKKEYMQNNIQNIPKTSDIYVKKNAIVLLLSFLSIIIYVKKN